EDSANLCRGPSRDQIEPLAALGERDLLLKLRLTHLAGQGVPLARLDLPFSRALHGIRFPHMTHVRSRTSKRAGRTCSRMRITSLSRNVMPEAVSFSKLRTACKCVVQPNRSSAHSHCRTPITPRSPKETFSSVTGAVACRDETSNASRGSAGTSGDRRARRRT